MSQIPVIALSVCFVSPSNLDASLPLTDLTDRNFRFQIATAHINQSKEKTVAYLY